MLTHVVLVIFGCRPSRSEDTGRRAFERNDYSRIGLVCELKRVSYRELIICKTNCGTARTYNMTP